MDNTSAYRGWYDVQDSKGVWRLGHCRKIEGGLMTIHLDGWSNKFDMIHCPHSNQLAPPRRYTKGLTTQLPLPLREPIEDFQQVVNIHNKLKLLLNSSPEQLEVEEIVSKGGYNSAFFRVELLVMVDGLLTLPFDFSDVHKGLEVNKFFFDIVNFVVKVLERGSNFLQTPENHKHKALQDACFELFVLIKSVFGLNHRHERFFNHTENIFIKRDAIIESFLKSEGGGLLLVNSYIRNVTAHCQCSLESFETQSKLIMTVMELYQSRLLPEQQNTRLNLVVDSITAYLKSAVKCDQVYELLTTTSQGKYMMNMLENMYIKLKPSKKFQIEQILGTQEARKKKRKGSEDSKEAKETEIKSTILIQKPTVPKGDSKRKKTGDQSIQALGNPPLLKNNQLSKLEERMAKLELQLAKQQEPPPNKEKDLLEDFFKEHAVQPLPQPKQDPTLQQTQEFDFNQLSFLSALQFHLSNGQQQEANRLISWRKKILQLAAIVGWDIAMVVARNTRDRLTVETKDILSTNLDYLRSKYNL